MRSLTLQTGDTIVVSGEEVGKLSFAASAESDGGSAIAVGARVLAQAEGSYQTSSNPTSLVFATASASAAASGKIKITDNGHVVPMANNAYDIGDQNLRFRNTYAASGYFSDRVATSGQVFFASGNTAPVGVMQWDDGEGTVTLGLKGGNVTAELGKNNVVIVYNGAGSTLTKGQVVYVSGAQGQRPSVNLALATSDLTSARTLGVVSETITAGSEGFVTTFGVVKNIDTSSFTSGSGLFLSATTPGALTMVRPTAPNHGVFVGWCLSSNVSAGRIFVEVQNGYELEEIHDVLITSPASGDVLRYDSSINVWKNTPLTSLGGATGATGPSGATGPAGGNWTRKTTTYTAVNTDRIIADTSGTAWTLTLPASPSAGNYVEITDGYNFAINNLTVGRNSSTIEGYADDVLLDISNTTYQFIYDGTTWEIVATAGKQGATGPSGATGAVPSGSASGVCFFGSGGSISSDTALIWNSGADVLTVNGRTVTNDLDINARYTESFDNIAISSNTLTVNLASGNLFTCSLNANINTMNVTNIPSGVGVGFTLIFTADGTQRTVTWPSGTKWPGGTSPTMTSGNAKIDVFSLLTTNSGVNWLGFVGGQNF
jgi:hypothetical protein